MTISKPGLELGLAKTILTKYLINPTKLNNFRASTRLSELKFSEFQADKWQCFTLEVAGYIGQRGSIKSERADELHTQVDFARALKVFGFEIKSVIVNNEHRNERITVRRSDFIPF